MADTNEDENVPLSELLAGKSVLRQQAITVYNQMRVEAVEQEDGRVLWSGAFTTLCDKTGISRGSYFKLRRRLEQLECITFLQRGNGMQSSVIALHRSPVDVDWSGGARKGLTGPPDAATIRQELDDIRRRVGTIDVVQALVALTEANEELERKIRKLELRFRKLAVKTGVDPRELEMD